LRTKTWQNISIALPAIALVIFFAFAPEIQIRKDSGSYLSMATQIISGEIFEKKELKEISFGRSIRTPGYPILIALSTGGDPFENSSYMLYTHFFIALAAMIFLSLALRQYCPPMVTAFAVLAIELLTKDFYAAIMTEFVAINVLLVLFGVTVRAMKNPSTRNIFFIGILAACAALLRPAGIVCFAIVPLMVIYRRRLNIVNGAVLASTLLPLLMWMSFNYYHLGAFTITQVSGLNAMGIGSQLGYVEPQPGDSQTLIKFIEDMNVKKNPPMGEEDEHIQNLDPSYKFLLLNNTYWIMEGRWQLSGAIPFDREYLWPYGTRAIKANLGNYFTYVTYGIGLFFSFVFPGAAIVMLVVPATGIYLKRNLVLSYTVLIMFMIHTAAGFLTAAYEAVWDRYIILTFYPYTLAVTICLFGLVFSADSIKKLTADSMQGKRKLLAQIFSVDSA
jgi:hypothetical protein